MAAIAIVSNPQLITLPDALDNYLEISDALGDGARLIWSCEIVSSPAGVQFNSLGAVVASSALYEEGDIVPPISAVDNNKPLHVKGGAADTVKVAFVVNG